MWCPLLKVIKFFFPRVLSLLLVLATVRSFASSLVILPADTYDPGVYAMSVVEVPASAREVAVSVKRDNWVDTGRDVVSIRVEFSDDGGKTWAFLFGFKTSGGQLRDKAGVVVESTWMKFPLTGGSHTQRRIKGSLEVHSPIATEVTIGFE